VEPIIGEVEVRNVLVSMIPEQMKCGRGWVKVVPGAWMPMVAQVVGVEALDTRVIPTAFGEPFVTPVISLVEIGRSQEEHLTSTTRLVVGVQNVKPTSEVGLQLVLTSMTLVKKPVLKYKVVGVVVAQVVVFNG
jgi:hypothetical protein